ncbi:MAG: MerR family transcriptional regulator [Chitinophagaceae bacterium]
MPEKFEQIAFEFFPDDSAIEESSAEDKAAELPAEPQIAESKEQKPELEKTVEQLIETRLKKRGRPSLKEMDITHDLIQIPPDEILFQKQYYSIGEVAKWFCVNQSLIRYWETEFDILQPRKNRKGDRFFRPVDVKNLVLIHDLIRRRKFTIVGAKDYLKKTKKAQEKFEAIQSLEKIKAFFLELKASL